MIVTIVVGSHRPDSMSLKVGRWLAERIGAQWPADEVGLVDLAEVRLPLWDPGVWANTAEWAAAFGPIGDRLRRSDALIAISPEYAGMATPALKNFFLLCTSEHLAHKPCLLVGVSAARGGAYPIAELRSSSYKNSHVCHIPEHLIVRDVAEVLNEAEPANRGDAYIRGRIDYALAVLRAYADGLAAVRQSGVIDHGRYPYGM